MPFMQGGEPTYVWWNGDWRYRIFIEINATNQQLTNTSLHITMNFSAELEYIGVGGTFDEDSVRVIEQNQTSGEVLHELPSHFFKFANYSASNNAQGIVLFKLTGTTELNTNRSIFIYFDTTDGVPKTPPSYSSYVNAWWAQYYPTTGTSYPEFEEALYTTPVNLEHTTFSINYQDKPNNFPAGADGSSPDWNNFAGNYTAYLRILTDGNYRFTTYTDDGSWVWINDTLVIENGGDHSAKNVTSYTYLKEGLHPLRFAYYEHGGKGTVRIYWKEPGSINYLLNGSALAMFTYSTLMNKTAPPTFNIHESTASYVIQAHIADTGGTPIVSTNVSIYDSENVLIRTGLTDQNGNATFFLPSNGSYTLVAKNQTDYDTLGGKI